MEDVKFFEGDDVLDFINDMEESEEKTRLLATVSRNEVGSVIAGMQMEEQGKQVLYFRKFDETSIILLGKGDEIRGMASRYVENGLMTTMEYNFIVDETARLCRLDREFDSNDYGKAGF